MKSGDYTKNVILSYVDEIHPNENSQPYSKQFMQNIRITFFLYVLLAHIRESRLDDNDRKT